MVARNESRTESRRTGAKWYNGAVCKKHPELNGHRMTSNGICLLCNREVMRSRRKANPEKYKEMGQKHYWKNREKRLKETKIAGRLRRTGVTQEMFDALLVAQDWKCGICSRELTGDRGTHSDHCHDKKKPRGLLCSTCNQAEGLIRRSKLTHAEYFRRMIDYLAHPPYERLNGAAADSQ